MGYNQMLGPGVNEKRDRKILPEISFRYAANRSLTLVLENHENRYPYVEGLDRTYALLQPLMRKRYVLPDDRGVKWESDLGLAVFAYRSFDLQLPKGAKVFRVEKGLEKPVEYSGSTMKTEPWTAYKIK
jgi:hypothetical protein